jgi:hypothetical protein
MDKQTKLYLGIGLLGVGIYLYFKPSKNMVGFVKPKPKVPYQTPPIIPSMPVPTPNTNTGTGTPVVPNCPDCKDGLCFDKVLGTVVKCTGNSTPMPTPLPTVPPPNPNSGGYYGGSTPSQMPVSTPPYGTGTPINTTPVPVPNAPTTTPINPRGRGFAGE